MRRIKGSCSYATLALQQVSNNSIEAYVVSDESHDLAWRWIAILIDDEEADPSLRRMAAKWLQR